MRVLDKKGTIYGQNYWKILIIHDIVLYQIKKDITMELQYKT